MDTHRLRYFLRVAEEGSMSRAARVLGVAEPAQIRPIRLLEEDLGVTVFRRTSRGVQLTEEGEQLRDTTAAPLRQLELAMQWVGSPLGRVERRLVLGMPASAARVLAAPLLSRLTAEFPKISLRIAVADSGQLVERMLKDEVDFAVLEGPPPGERLFYFDILSEDQVLVGGPDSELEHGQAVSFSDLAELPMVVPGLQTGLSNTLQNTALRRKITINTRFETDSLQVTKDLIEAGLGYGVLPLSACGEEVAAGRLRWAPLRDPVISQHVGLAIRALLGLPRGFVTTFASTIRDEAARLIASGAWPATLLAPYEWKDEPHAQLEVSAQGGSPQRSLS